MVVGQTHVRGGPLDVLMTGVTELVWVAVVASIGNSDQSSVSAVISMAQAVPNLCISWKIFLKRRVNWNTVCDAIQDLPWRNIRLADNPVEVLYEQLPCWLNIMNQPKFIMDQPTRISHSLMMNAIMLLASFWVHSFWVDP